MAWSNGLKQERRLRFCNEPIIDFVEHPKSNWKLDFVPIRRDKFGPRSKKELCVLSLFTYIFLSIIFFPDGGGGIQISQ